ncbi:MAG: tetratricopeptide repeat protein [Armatimonadota bacterium]|nr:tetratricopeptide repeat protein [Armatimonadota bacterium]
MADKVLGNKETNKAIFIVGIILVMGTIIVFSPVISCGFLNYDDEVYVTDNPYVQAGPTVQGITWVFTSMRAGNWHPLTWLSHMLDCRIYGLNAAGHHITSLVIHALNVLFLFLLLVNMTGFVWRSAFVAALFAIHPLHVESVVWIAERKDVLSTFFGMLATWAYIRYTRAPGIKAYFLVLVLFSLGLMSKPMLVTLPFVFLLLDYWPLGRIANYNNPLLVVSLRQVRNLLLEKLPLFVISLFSCVITFIAQQSGGAIASFERIPLGVRVANALVAYISYVIKMLYPVKLAVLYPHPGNSLPAWSVVGSASILIIFTIWVARGARSKPYILVGWLWYIVTLVPVIGFIQIGIQAMADRYTYIPLIGLFIIIAWGIPDLMQCLQKTGTTKETIKAGDSILPFAHSLFSLIPAVTILFVFAVQTWIQIGYWRDNVTLFRRALAVTTGNYLAHQNLGVALFHQGELEAAAKHFGAALKLKPSYAPAHNGLGTVFMCQGKDDEALEHFKAALKCDPHLEDAHSNLAVIMQKYGRDEEAIAHYRQVLQINPDRADTHNNIGLILAKLGRFDEATRHFYSALKLKPKDAEVHCNLGSSLVKLGEFNKAVRHLEVAIEINPKLVEAHYNLGNALVSLGKLDEAAYEYRLALRIKPNHILARNNLAAVWYLQGEYSEAWKEIQQCRNYGGTPNPELIRLLSAKKTLSR